MKKYIQKLKLGFGIVALATTSISLATLHNNFDQFTKNLNLVAEWRSNLLDLENTKSLKAFKQELSNTVLPQLGSALVALKGVNCSQAEQELHALAQLLDDTFRAAFAELNPTKSHLLAEACYLPDFLDTVRTHLDKLIVYAQAEDPTLATQITDFRDGFFQQLYSKWQGLCNEGQRYRYTFYMKAFRYCSKC